MVAAARFVGALAVGLAVLTSRAAEALKITPLPALTGTKVGFTQLPAPTLGISFTNFVRDERTITNRNLLSGSGVALGDVDGDGWCDVFFSGLDSPSELYRNLGGWKFTNVTVQARLTAPAVPRDATGAAFADVDADGDLDLLVNSMGGGTRLFRNDGLGRFEDITDAAGLRSNAGATSLALADVDGDGDVDLYACHFRPDTILDQPQAKFGIRQVGGRPVVISMNGRSTAEPDLTNRFELGPTGQVIEFGQPDVLWLNDGTGRFTAASWTDGTFLDEDGRPLKGGPNDWGLAAQFHDVNGDGRPDLYVCNDLHTPDRFWLNASTNGRPVFRAVARTALRNNSTFSMGVDFGDLNRDGHVDLFTVDMLARRREHRATQQASMAPMFRRVGEFEDRVQLQRNALQLNRGDATFAEAALQAGIEASDWSWGPIFLDVDLDGFEDILIPNGQLRDFQDSDGAARASAAQRGGRPLTLADMTELVHALPRFDTPNAAFRNRTGETGGWVPTFADVSADWGFTANTISQGAALADLDRDGDLDLVTNDLLGPPGCYRNDAAGPRLAIRLRGSGRNSRAIGARLEVTGGAVGVQQQEVIGGGRYLSGDDGLRTFATGQAGQVGVTVRWPSGRTSQIAQVPANSLLEVAEPTDAPSSASVVSSPKPTFIDVSDRLNHLHPEEPFNDFERQGSLLNRLSQLGPGVTWADLNGDGHDDLLVGAGRSGPLAAFQGDGKGGFTRLQEAPFNKPVGRDLTTILPLGGALLVGSANYEDGQTNGGCVRIYDLARKASGDSVLGQAFSAGPLAAADVDGDGALEVFVGGRVVAGRWPEAAPSLLLRNAGGRFVVGQRFEGLGLITGACFTDLDGDGDADLALAGEWGPLRLFRNDGGTLAAWNPALSLAGVGGASSFAALQGLWTGIAAGDFDADGRLDLVAANWGHNTRFHARPETPWRLHFGDFGSGAGMDVADGWLQDGREWSGREYPVWAMLFPWFREQVPSFAAFSRLTLAEVLGDRLKTAAQLEVNWLASTLFLNRGDRFEVRPLPDVAQLAPAFGLAVGDYDGDGSEDVFLAQNWSGAEPSVARNDAGRGLWLRGDGKGGFAAELNSGVELYGEGRGAALADFDADGRVDLAVGQNGVATKLFRNVGARPGLRVRLTGAGGEPVMGAAVRLAYGERRGPWREAHLGGGYWSVDSPTLVLGKAGQPTAVEVRWPGGKVTVTALAADAREVRVSADGR